MRRSSPRATSSGSTRATSSGTTCSAGWFAGLYSGSSLGEELTLKGRERASEGYFPATRFSDDLDFTTPRGVNSERLIEQFNEVCQFAGARSGVQFDLDRNQVHGVHAAQQEG